MRDYLEPMLGATGALVAQFAITLAVVLILVAVVFWLIRRFTGGRFGSGTARGRQPRLSVLDALPIDPRRRLVLIRRDNVEHLILIGGPTDLVVETSIHRSPPGQRRPDPMANRQAQPAPAARPAPTAPAEAPRSLVEAARPVEPRRAEPAPRVAVYETEFTEERTPERPEPAREEFVETTVETDAPLQPAAQSEPEPEAPAYAEPPAPQPSRAPAPPIEPRTPRGLPSFLTGGRSRQTPTLPSADDRRDPPRTRSPEPAQRPANSPFSRAPDPQQSVPEALEETAFSPDRSRGGEFARSVVPPAPIAAPRPLGDEPYGAPESDSERPLRFEPIFDVGPTETDYVSPSDDGIPQVEAPHTSDQPLNIDAAFDENAPVIELEPNDTSGEPPLSPVGDLEKEMARLLGEISGSRKK